MSFLTPRGWRVVSGGAFHRHVFPGEVEELLYHEGPGDLHLLGSDEAAILAALGTGPIDLAALVARVAAARGLMADDALHFHVEETVEQLERLGLVVRT